MPRGELPPPAPRDCFGRDDLVEEVVQLAENLKPIALIGAGGIGKTSVALTVLHHKRIKERFGGNRRFIRCDEFPASRTNFLARLSKVIGAGVENPEDLTSLRPFLSSEEMIIVLDNAESILDSRGIRAKEIYPVVDELCQSETICLLITSRITTVPPCCKRPEITTLSMEAACDIFYGIYGNRRESRVINDLLQRLDFHALSITLLATTASRNGWDHDRLANEWYTQRAQVLRADHSESLAATLQLSLASPTFHGLGPSAHDLIGVVAFFPQGIDENNIDWLFPIIPNRKDIFDRFHVLSLTYRSNGFVTMLAPIRDYFCPQDPRSSPLLCITMVHYFRRLSVDVHPSNPLFEEGRWIASEDVNVEHLLDVFTSSDPERGFTWEACFDFMKHLYWFKPRQTILGSKIEALPDDHKHKSKYLLQLSRLFEAVGHHMEQKRLLVDALKLQRWQRDDPGAAFTLRCLSSVNRLLCHYEEGIRQAKEALAIYERMGVIEGQMRCFGDLARVLADDKQLDAAEDAANRAIDLIPEKGQEFLLCQLHRVLGKIYQSKGKKREGVQHLQTALGIASPPNWQDELFWIHYSLAELFRDEHEFDEANVHVDQVKSHAVDSPYYLGRATDLQARIWYRQGRLEDSKSEALRALKIFEELGSAQDAEDCRKCLREVERAFEISSTCPQR